jgi:hypothetical protein
MPLSEYEQRVLEQMEQQLTSDDPRLVNALQGGAPNPVRRWLLTGAGALVGLAVLVIGAVTSLPIVGVLGFVTMFVAVVLALSPPRRHGPAGLVAPDGTVKGRKGPAKQGLSERLEKRWDRRREEREG